MKELLIFACINLLASTLSGAAGGGGSLIGVPVMILLGLSPATAIATGKFTGVGLASGGSLRFYREKLTTRRTIVIFSSIGALGAVVGSVFLIRFGASHEAVLQRITGFAILVIGIPMLYIRNLGVDFKERPLFVRRIGYGLIFAVAAFQAALSAGMGAMQTMVLMSFFGMTALVASATRRAMQLIISGVSLLILLFAGIPNVGFGLVGFTTALLGGYLGAHIAVKKGNKFVINLFAITSALLALQLLWR